MNTIPHTPQVSSGAMIRTLGLIATLSGFLVVLVYQLTLPRIHANQQAAIERAIYHVVPGAVSSKTFTLTSSGLIAGERSGGTDVYAAYGKDGRLAGIAAEAAAPGYQDVIRLLYGYSPKCQCITGISILQMTETPGLGDRIATDKGFLANFKALDARTNAQDTALAHPIKTVKHGTKTHPWQIDAISGATISSTGVGHALDESAEKLLPKIRRYLPQLEAN